LRALLDNTATAGGRIDVANAIALYEYIVQLKPQEILELGPGLSTLVICLAIDELRAADRTYAPRFLGIEEHLVWVAHLESGDDARLLEHVTIAIHPTTSGDGAAWYLDIPRRPYDFVFVDGPDHVRQGCAWSRDVLDLAPDFAARVCIVRRPRGDSAGDVDGASPCRLSPPTPSFHLWF
jgi:hypothetical protein